MKVRTKAIFYPSIVAVALASFGCAMSPEHARFQNAFLPPVAAPPTAFPEPLEPPTFPQTSLYAKELPNLLKSTSQMAEMKSAGDALARTAEQCLQRGRRYYQLQDISRARKEFDTAVDLMFEAQTRNPADRRTYERRLDEMVESIHRLDLAGMGASAELEQNAFEKAPLEDILQMTFPVDPRMKDMVRDQVAATVSQLPLTVTDAVLSYISYFNNRGRRTLMYGLQRSGRYRPMIQRILDEEGVPQELIYLAQAESGFMPRAKSRAAAVGMWQFMASRGSEYGLKRTALYDDRMDPEKATRAAARHLRDLFEQFGDWYLAIAAYNCGPVTVERAVERTGYADFWELRRRGALPAETTNYVPIILALTIMQKNPGEYGIVDVQLDPSMEYETVEIAAPTSLALVADITGAPTPELTALNPSLLKSTVPGDYVMNVPKGTGTQLLTALQLIPMNSRESWRLHRVGSGETLLEIGKRYGTSEAAIASVNRIQSEGVVEGDNLIIPAALRAATPAKKTAARKSSTRRTTASRAKARTSKASASASKKSTKTATGASSKSAKGKAAASKPSTKAPADSAKRSTKPAPKQTASARR